MDKRHSSPGFVVSHPNSDTHDGRGVDLDPRRLMGSAG